MTDPPPGPLSGLTGIVLTQAWAGTFATQLLGLLGMEIIQIEARQRIDSWRGGYGGAVPKALRGNPAAVHPWNTNPLYNSVNLNKQAITLDLSRPEGIDLFKRLIPFADVVAENFSPRVMHNLGIGYEELARIKPDVILLSMSAYGATGPYRDIPGIGGTIEPMSGMSSLLGYEDGPPLNSGQMYPDPVAGYYGASALLLALRHRHRTGQGQWIDLSMQDANMTFIADALMEYSALGRIRPRMGNRHPTIAPYGVYSCTSPDQADPSPDAADLSPGPSPTRGGEPRQTKDESSISGASEREPSAQMVGSGSPPRVGEGSGEGLAWIALVAESDAQFARLASAAGHPEWSEDPRFASPAARKQNEGALDGLIAAWTAEHTAAELESRLRAAGVPAARVRDAHDVLDEAHLWERGSLVWVEHPEAGRHAQMAAPWRLSRTPGGVTRPAPGLGEHSREALARYLGIDDAEYERLVALGITGEGPPD